MKESAIQIAVAEHLRMLAQPGTVWFHPPNGGFRNVREAVKLKRMGVRAGVSDIIAIRRGEIFGLELKADKGRPTEGQLEFLSDLRAAGGHGCVAEGLDEALACLKAWGLVR